MSEDDDARAALVRLVRDEGTRVLATLVRIVGDVDLAQDAVQEAVLAALVAWPRDGVPDVPRAWLTAAARSKAVDVLRREARREGKEVAAVSMLGPDETPAPEVVRDDLLRLVFTCCHPALAPDAQVALALRTLCGLTTAEVARALLVPEAAMLKRLTRAKQKIARAGIPYRVPAAADLPDRMSAVAAVVYLLFTEGHSATSGDDAVRVGLVEEAVRLGRLLHDLMPDDATVVGLLALMLLHDARRAARTDDAGDVVLLDDQDRALWDRARIHEGVLLVGEGLRRTPQRPDPYVVQAAIAACHALAPTAGATDWAAVVSWYDVLLTVADGPVPRLARAVALGRRDGPQAGLAAVQAVTGLAGYPSWHVARAEELARLGRAEEAAVAWDAALALETNESARRHMVRRRADLRAARP